MSPGQKMNVFKHGFQTNNKGIKMLQKSKERNVIEVINSSIKLPDSFLKLLARLVSIGAKGNLLPYQESTGKSHSNIATSVIIVRDQQPNKMEEDKGKRVTKDEKAAEGGRRRDVVDKERRK